LVRNSRRTNVPYESLLVVIAVLAFFASFSGILAFATLDESRRRPQRHDR